MTLCTSPPEISQMMLWASWGPISWCGNQWYPSIGIPSSLGSMPPTGWRSLWLIGLMPRMDNMTSYILAQVCWKAVNKRERYSMNGIFHTSKKVWQLAVGVLYYESIRPKIALQIWKSLLDPVNSIKDDLCSHAGQWSCCQGLSWHSKDPVFLFLSNICPPGLLGVCVNSATFKWII